MPLHRLLLVLLACCCGCTILNAPDRNALSADGGLDADADGTVPDADARMPDGGDGSMPDGGTDQEDCANGTDDDGDGLIDCADFDCANEPTCCTDQQDDDLLNETWDPGVPLEGRWLTIPRDAAAYPTRESNQLVAFDRDDIPNGIVRTKCVGLELGAKLAVELTAKGSESCDAAECDLYAGIVLSGAQNMAPGRHLIDDLGVFLDGIGSLVVTQGRALCRGDEECEQEHVLARCSDTGEPEIRRGDKVRAVVHVTPGIDRTGRAALFATVDATNQGRGGAEQRLVTRFPFVRQDHLIRNEADCGEAGGLFAAVEGRGSAVEVGPLTVGSSQCSNPGHFGPADDADILERDDLDLDPEQAQWAAWGFGSPALAGSCAATDCWLSGRERRWDILFEATNADTELPNRVGYALGHVVSRDDWASWMGHSEHAQKAGDDVPTCLGDLCEAEDLTSLRDPSVLAIPDEQGLLDREDGEGNERRFLIAYAKQVDDDPWAEQFELRVRRAACSGSSLLSSPQCTFDGTEAGSGVAVIDREAAGGCDSLRHPELLPAEAGDRTPYWLLYTCEREGEPDSIRYLRLGDELGVGAESHPLLMHHQLDSVDASLGVRAPEAVVDFGDGDEPVMLRLWVVAVGTNGAQIALLAASADKREFESELVSTLSEYGANPVLPADGTAGAPCSGDCKFLGFDVAMHGDRDPAVGRAAPRRLRFLLGRSINDVDGFRHQFVPLDQSWHVSTTPEE